MRFLSHDEDEWKKSLQLPTRDNRPQTEVRNTCVKENSRRRRVVVVVQHGIKASLCFRMLPRPKATSLKTISSSVNC